MVLRVEHQLQCSGLAEGKYSTRGETADFVLVEPTTVQMLKAFRHRKPILVPHVKVKTTASTAKAELVAGSVTSHFVSMQLSKVTSPDVEQALSLVGVVGKLYLVSGLFYGFQGSCLRVFRVRLGCRTLCSDSSEDASVLGTLFLCFASFTNLAELVSDPQLF